jgi:hypothetical protein
MHPIPRMPRKSGRVMFMDVYYNYATKQEK